MKPLNELDAEALRNLVSFNTAEKTYYYSGITAISKDAPYRITYNGDTFESNSKVCAKIREGKQAYELYMLAMHHNRAQDIINTQASQILEEKFQSRIDEITASFEATMNTAETRLASLTNQVNQAVDTLQNSISTVDAVTSTTRHMNEDLLTTISNFDATSINEKVTSKINEVNSIKQDMKVVLGTFNTVVTQLQDLFDQPYELPKDD